MDKNYCPELFEGEIYKNWLDKNYFATSPDSREHYSIVMPPLNVTGKAHIGHALDNTMQDILIRTKRMQGYNTLWVPGTDHAAIATEQVLVKDLKRNGESKESIGREEFLKRGWQWYGKYTHVICDQLKKLGVSCDWNRLAFTMDENLNRAVRHVFCQYYKEGLIYKGKRVVNYCPSCKTTISDNENVHVDQNTYLWYIRYPFADGSGEVVVATTRPETLFGDTAVAVNPNDARFKGQVGKDLILPLVNKKIKLIADDYCEIGFGTGAVKITPAHDPNDYEVGLRHNLEVVNCIDDDGKLTECAGQFAGLDRIEARPLIEKALIDGGYLVKKEKYKNQVGTCERCGAFTEPRISTQWFVKMKDLARPAIEAVKTGKLTFHPKRYEKTYLNWLENIQDWCISRQIWLGHRIPVFTCANGHTFASEDFPTECPVCKSAKLEQDNDVLDTWFSSALWPFSTLGYPEQTEDLKYYYPTSTLVTGYDIITFWVSKMVFSGIKFMGDVPFKDVVIHGLVRDIHGVKMSKHLGNGVDPIDMIDKYGADALRLSLINGMSAGTDIKYGEEKAKEAKIFINKLYNASKFVLQNVKDIEIKPIDRFKLQEKDKWILSELDKLVKSVNKNIDKYALGVATSNLIEFTVSKFCDWYIELSKVDLYSGNAEDMQRTQNILLYTLSTLLKVFHPFIPFVTEYIYRELPGSEETIMYCSYPKKVELKGLKNNFDRVINIIRAIRNARAEFNVPDNKKTSIYILPDEKDALIEENLEEIAKLSSGSDCKLIASEPDEKCTKIICENVKIYLPMGQLVDQEKEKMRLEKEIEKLKFEVARSEKMLSNQGFVSKAPEKLITQEKEKLENNRALLAKIQQEFNSL